MYRSARYGFLCERFRFDPAVFERAPVRVASRVAAPSNSNDDAASRSTCFMVH